jgi:hypothetical protein
MSYQEDTDKKDQGWAILDEGSTPSVPNEDNPTIMAATTLAISEDAGTYKIPSKWAVHITTSATLIPYRSEDTNVR